MNDDELRREIQDFYAAERLSDEAVERLLSASEVERDVALPSRRRFPRVWLAAAALVLAGVSAVLYLQVQRRREEADPTRITAAVAVEIVGHHCHEEPVEFTATTFDALREQMRRLDFRLVEPRRIREQGLEVVGARYCSIRGGLAVQIKLRDAKGEIRTLYQCPVRTSLRRVEDGEVALQGVDVVLWREGDLLLGMARGGVRSSGG